MSFQSEFNEAEIEFMQNRDLFPWKRDVMSKIAHTLNEVKLEMIKQEIHKHPIFPIDADRTTGKLSRGENTLGQPWMILDFPRLFNKEQVIACRTLFAWSYPIQQILHINGKAFNNLNISDVDISKTDRIKVACHKEEWIYLGESTDWRPANSVNKSEIENSFRLSMQSSLENIAILPQVTVSNFKEILSVLRPTK
jgi:hypothetical protein